MLFQTAADGIPPIALQLGIPTFVGVFVYMVWVEAFTLHQRDWGTWKEVFGISALMNGISVIASFLLLLLVYDIWEGFVLAFLLSILIEMAVLLCFRRGQWRQVIWNSFLTNATSYVFLGSLMAIGLK